MDLEQLSKHQIVLLTLLVSFVTSIATGIVTVSLMDQAPSSVSHTINEVVERTVQTVTQPAAATAQNIAPVTKTVVVDNDDMAAQSIASVQKSIIHLVVKGGDQLVARGVITSQNGSAVTDAAALAASGATSFEAILADGERVPVSIPANQSTSTPLLQISVAVGTSTGFAPAQIFDSSKLQLGTSIIRIGGTGTDIVDEGIISELPAQGSGMVQTNAASTIPGSLIMTYDGQVIGIATTDSLNADSSEYTLLDPAPQATTSATSTS